MRWLQWSTIDLEKGLGGVEVHARSQARELSKLGVQTAFSRNPADLDRSDWDVILTHGGSIVPRRGNSKAVRVHTLHGTTLGRMAACGEWTWPGGYAAYLREVRGVFQSDVILSVHPGLSLYHLAQKLGKTTAVCWNGWDADDQPQKSSSQEWKKNLPPPASYWAFIGRGADRVKGADRLKATIRLLPDLKWVAAPGEGFETIPEVIKTGALDSTQVRELMLSSAGLILPSLYEGFPLVVLEALAQGTPVVATRVGGVTHLPDGVQGLITADSGDPRALADAIRAAARFELGLSSREQRARVNQSILPSWNQVAVASLNAVEEFRKKGSLHG